MIPLPLPEIGGFDTYPYEGSKRSSADIRVDAKRPVVPRPLEINLQAAYLVHSPGSESRWIAFYPCTPDMYTDFVQRSPTAKIAHALKLLSACRVPRIWRVLDVGSTVRGLGNRHKLFVT